MLSTIRLSVKPLGRQSAVLRSSFASQSDQKKVFDMIVIGGGSGGVSCAKRSAEHGAKVAIIEGKKYGGTCVNVGCVPKKIMFNCSHVAEVLHDAHHFGFKDVGQPSFDWAAIKVARDRYIQRLNGIYERGLDGSKVSRFSGQASFVDNQTVRVGDELLTARHIVIATGGEPNLLNVPGEEHVIDSDGFFALTSQPKKVAIIGGGYIAVELAGLFNGLGTDTTLLVRGEAVLRNFDNMLSTHLTASMTTAGIKMVTDANTDRVVKEADGSLSVHLQDGRHVGGFDVVLRATGRHPNTQALQLQNTSVATAPETGRIVVDDYQNTSAPGIAALGDVIGRLDLTPMAIAAGRRLGDRLFGGMPHAKADYSFVPTVMFSHPVIGTVGYSEEAAQQQFGESSIKVYTSSFINLWYGSYFEGGVGDKPVTKYKLVCAGPEERVVGLHCIGMASDEVLQGFGVAIKMGATKADFDNCVAIHPTSAEEMVTMAPWGMSGKN